MLLLPVANISAATFTNLHSFSVRLIFPFRTEKLNCLMIKK